MRRFTETASKVETKIEFDPHTKEAVLNGPGSFLVGGVMVSLLKGEDKSALKCPVCEKSQNDSSMRGFVDQHVSLVPFPHWCKSDG